MRVREVSCRHALVPSSLPGLDYALNPYRGCSHGCAYCYAPNVLHETRKWGTFVDVRSDMPSVLAQEMKRKREGVVSVGTVTDAYQPVEARFKLTRGCLIRFLDSSMQVSIQTKSSLVIRDMDILTKLNGADVGFTFTTMDRYLARAIEPLASEPRKRLEAMTTLTDAGIEVWAFIGPYLPGLKEGKLESMVSHIREAGVKKIIGDILRIRKDTMERLHTASLQMLADERSSFLSDLGSKEYSSTIDEDLKSICRETGIEFEPAFPAGRKDGKTDSKTFSF